MAEGEGTAGKTASKAGSFFQRHKTALIIVAAVFGLFIVWVLMRNNQANQANSLNSANPQGTTGWTPQNLQGPPGSAGPAGPRGPRGRRGKRGLPGSNPGRGNLPPSRNQNQPAVATANQTQFHTAQPGDTMTSVAARHGYAGESAIFAMNPTVIGSGQVMPGQRLRVR